MTVWSFNCSSTKTNPASASGTPTVSTPSSRAKGSTLCYSVSIVNVLNAANSILHTPTPVIHKPRTRSSHHHLPSRPTRYSPFTNTNPHITAKPVRYPRTPPPACPTHPISTTMHTSHRQPHTMHHHRLPDPCSLQTHLWALTQASRDDPSTHQLQHRFQLMYPPLRRRPAHPRRQHKAHIELDHSLNHQKKS